MRPDKALIALCEKLTPPGKIIHQCSEGELRILANAILSIAKFEYKQVWIAWGNTDLTEGRGQSFPMAISECRATAVRYGYAAGVQGTDCDVQPYSAIRINGNWLAPFLFREPTPEDLAADNKYNTKQAAIAKCRAAGVGDKTIEELLQ